MSNFEIISGLRDLISDRESFIEGDKDFDDIFLKDIEVLKEALKLAKKQNKLQKLVRNTVASFWTGAWACFVLYTFILILYKL